MPCLVVLAGSGCCPGRLTPTELEVTRLVTAGLRNEAIAQRLFIAAGTVKVHLTHIFTKLGMHPYRTGHTGGHL